jgi:hypothetical protein
MVDNRRSLFTWGARMNRSAGAAARLSGGERKHLAVRALAGGHTISSLADGHGVSRKFVYEQKRKAGAALDDAFTPAPEAGRAGAVCAAGHRPLVSNDTKLTGKLT